MFVKPWPSHRIMLHTMRRRPPGKLLMVGFAIVLQNVIIVHFFAAPVDIAAGSQSDEYKPVATALRDFGGFAFEVHNRQCDKFAEPEVASSNIQVAIANFGMQFALSRWGHG